MARVERAAPAADAPAAQWVPGLVLLGLIWGASFLFIKVGVSELHPLYVALGRIGCGAVVLTAAVAVTRSRLPRDPVVWLHNALLGVIGVAAPFALFAYGEQRVSSVLAGIWNSMTPLIVLPLAVAVFRTERMTVRGSAGLALGLIGAFTLLGVWRGVGGASLAGQLMCLGAAACYGVSIPYTKRYLASRAESGLVTAWCQLVVATAVLAVVAPLVTGVVPVMSELSWPVIGSVVVLGAVGTGLAYVLHQRNIRLVGATTASMVTYIIPVFATVIGIVVLGERLEWFQPVGGLLVLAGVAVSQGLFRRRMVRRRDDRDLVNPVARTGSVPVPVAESTGVERSAESEGGGR